ncbi:MAG: hypothetical protein ABII10_02370 [Candidatus Paceibacterota bacterium]
MNFKDAELGFDPSKYLSSPKEKITKVRFGDVCIRSWTTVPRLDTLSKSIVLGLRKQNTIHTFSIIKDSFGEEAIHPNTGGTNSTDEVIEIVDHWSLERIIEAYRRGWKLFSQSNEEPPFDFIKKLRDEAQQSS